jgi:hypothetical protein
MDTCNEGKRMVNCQLPKLSKGRHYATYRTDECYNAAILLLERRHMLNGDILDN